MLGTQGPDTVESCTASVLKGFKTGPTCSYHAILVKRAHIARKR